MIQSETWITNEISRVNEQNRTIINHRVIGTVRMALAPQARFTREGIGIRVRKWFGRKEAVEVGDSLFDDAIYVESSTPDLMRRLLVNEGLQGVIMEAVTALGQISFEPVEGACLVRVRTANTVGFEHRSLVLHQRIVAIALHHLSSAT